MAVVNIVILKNELPFPQDGNLVDEATHVLTRAIEALDIVLAVAESDPGARIAPHHGALDRLAADLQELRNALQNGVAAEFTA